MNGGSSYSEFVCFGDGHDDLVWILNRNIKTVASSCVNNEPDYKLQAGQIPTRMTIMRNLIYILLLVATVLVPAFGQKAAAGTNDPTKGVHDTFDRLVEGIKQADAAKVMGVYEKSDRILFFNNNGTATMGWDTMRQNRESLYTKTKNVSLDITGLRIEMLGKTAAYATCKWKQSQEFDGKLENASGRMTLVFKLIGKDWKIVHLHTSPDNPSATRPVFPSEKQNN
jgi:ketosteroid isomerase-like protein